MTTPPQPTPAPLITAATLRAHGQALAAIALTMTVETSSGISTIPGFDETLHAIQYLTIAADALAAYNAVLRDRSYSRPQ